MRSTWPHFERLFTQPGAPRFCWCTPYRVSGRTKLDRVGKQEAMKALVQGGTPVGLLAYRGGEPVGWCSIAPREAYPNLERSRTMPRVDEEPTWTVLCFFVIRVERGTGVARTLLEAGVEHAFKEGARVVEGYPFGTAGTTSTHRGHSSMFAACGFAREGERRWVRRRDVRG